MNSFSLALLVVPMIAVAAPLIATVVGRVVKVPIVVFEILLGIILGPSLLGWVQPDEFTTALADFGLAMLFFMAGTEIDFAVIRGRPLTRAALGWAISLAAGLAVAIAFTPTLEAGVIVGIALVSTALGTLLPVLRDAGELHTPFGTAVIAVGAAGEFGPLLAISLFLSGRNPGLAAVVLLGFAVIAAVAITIAARGKHTGLYRLISATLHTSGQLAIRLVVLIIAALVVLSVVLGLDMLLGAFAAGVLWRVFVAHAQPADRHVVEIKIDAIAFGFLVPIFFVNTGLTFDLPALLGDPTALVLLPVLLVLLVLVRGLPGLLAAPVGSSRADKRAIVFFSATGLPVIVAVTTIGTDTGLLSSALAAALVAAGMLSVLFFPVLGLAQHQRSTAAPPAPGTAGAAP